MKKIFFSLLLLIGAIGANAQTVKVYKASTMVYSSTDADSVVFRQTTVPVDESTHAFSVSEQRQVIFSPGNLQYTRSTNTWAFAEHQYDIIGEANVIGGALADKIDFFGWSTDNTATPFGVSSSSDIDDYDGDFVDWGTNTIGSDAPNTWRTLTKDEWDYLFRTRPNADKRNGIARIYLSDDKSQYADGLILLPDDWTCPAGITFKEGGATGDNPYADHQTFTLAQWQALEEAEAVFLPAAGARYGTTVSEIMDYGFYWSATAEETEYEGLLRAYTFYVEPDNIMLDVYDRKSGQSVRLVRDVQTPAAGSPAHTSAESTEEITTQVVTIYQPGGKVSRFNDVDSVVFMETAAYTGKFSISADKQVAFAPGNLQYTQSTDTWAFAEHQYDIIGEANIIGGALADKIDLFGWSASNTTAPFGVSLSKDKADYAGDFVDWGTNTIGTDAPNTWRTLTKDEWTYLFQHTHWTMATVNDVLGFMLLPDGFVAPTGITVTILGDGTLSDSEFNFNESEYAGNVYTAAVFALLESLGVVFLPCAGNRYEATVDNVGSYGGIWLATSESADDVLQIYFESTEVLLDTWYRNIGLSVRLVRDL